ncbi:MBG domain-containing protein [Flammeovirgaceae bacterium SG7u.111]|nr:MBG domain-containing protein [Flammeovirgaceae bacterium SG7u.132]WPO38237.1 MBG domain-containing protein [Flammeovirgaceae bacterium SG7u.111]
MKTSTTRIALYLILLFSPFISLAQVPTKAKALEYVKEVNKKKVLLKLSKKLKKQTTKDKEYAVEFAQKNDIPIFIRNNNFYGELLRVTPSGKPIYIATTNVDAAKSIGTDRVWDGGDLGLDLSGDGMTIGVWDAGAVLASHEAFSGRASQKDNVTITDYHATHVGGTMVGAGINADAKGMAYEANLSAYDWNNDDSEMATEGADGLLISNHSYGIVAGWYLDNGVWKWNGDDGISDQEDWKFGFYSSGARSWDQIAYNSPYYLIFKSAGNDRGDGPENGDHPQDGSYDCISFDGVAKNIMTIGAVADVVSYSTPEDVVMSSFSSWGPTDDGRIKPDVVANGVELLSAWNTGNSDYQKISGTSMATPSAAGSALLLQEHYQELNGRFMKSATLKGLIIHTADEAGAEEGPDYAFGWGLMNIGKAAKLIGDNGIGHQILEKTLLNSDSFELAVDIGAAPAVLTLAWTDVAGTPVNSQLDPSSLMLVNDLDMRLVGEGQEFMPYILDPANPSVAATKGDNFRDNVEKIYLSAPTPGTYTIKIKHKGSLSSGIQDFSLIISGTEAPLGSICYASDTAELGTNLAPRTPYWYTFTPTQDGLLNLSTSGSTTKDTKVSIFAACGGNLIYSGDDEDGEQTDVSFLVSAGEELFFMWDNAADTTGFAWDLSINPVSPSMELDSLVLVELYKRTDGGNWEDNSSWLSSEALSNWYGIETNEDGRVRKIDLSENELNGKLPNTLKFLGKLDSFAVFNNELYGELPDSLDKWKSLSYFSIANNKVEGELPAYFGEIDSLRTLSLSNNELSGTIPPLLGNAINLKKLYIANNKLEGKLPPELWSLANLEELTFAGNSLSDTISTEIGQLSKLVKLSFSRNDFYGEIPLSIGSLTELEELYLGSNRFTGSVPDTIATLEKLATFKLEENQFNEMVDLSGSAKMASLNYENNYFTFEDILPNIGISEHTYSPQLPVGEEIDTTLNKTDDFLIVLGIDSGVVGNEYKWYKDDLLIKTTTSDTLTLTGEGKIENATYTCKVTNSGASVLTLTSLDVNVIDTSVYQQTIDFEEIPDKTFTDNFFKLIATASSGLPVKFEVLSGLDLAGVSNDTVTILGVGEVTIKASQAGNVNYYSAEPVERSFMISKSPAVIVLDSLAQPYTGASRKAAARTVPTGLVVDVTYNGSSAEPTEIGKYGVIASLVSDFYEADPVSDSLEITKGTGQIVLSDLEQVYDGTLKQISFETVPANLIVQMFYNDVPINAGKYGVEAVLNDENFYPLTVRDSLHIKKAQATIEISNLEQVFDRTQTRSVAVTTDPAGLDFRLTYNDSAELPLLFGSYTVEVTIVDDNYEGTKTETFVITGISEELSKRLILYPNPTSGLLKLQDNSGFRELGAVKVFDSSGKEVLGKKLTALETSIEIDLREFSNGAFILLIQRGEKSAVKRIIKN